MAEAKEFTPKSEEEIRQSVIADYDLDPNDDETSGFIDKAVKKELDWQTEKFELSKKNQENEKKLSKAIEQKTHQRTEKEELKAKLDALLSDDENNNQPNSTPEPTTPKPDNEELSSLKKTVEEIKTSQHRQKFSLLSEDEYSTFNDLAKANGKEFFDDDMLANNPVIKNYMESNKVKERIENATTAPSSRSSSQGKTEEDKISIELDRDLPPGFSSRKKV
jgi:hypothetical protein